MEIKHLTRNRGIPRGYCYLLTLAMLALLTACGKASETETYKKTEHRRDFALEEFGIGRPHTKDHACNREIDQLLDAVRICYNTRPEAECAALQEKQSDHITRLKNSTRCRR